MKNIICKQAFNKLKEEFKGVRSLHISWVHEIWERAEAAMQRKSVQKPALEHKLNNVSFDECMKDNLTQQELQFLKTFFEDELYQQKNQIRLSKIFASKYFSLCDADKEGTEHFFKCLNNEKDELRRLKKRYNKLAEIQRKIKRQLT